MKKIISGLLVLLILVTGCKKTSVTESNAVSDTEMQQ